MQVNGRTATVKRLGHSLSMYTNPPSEEVTIDDFELFALDRLQLLRGLELLKTRGVTDTTLEDKIRQVGRARFFV
jgi:DNA primase large subunit